ISFESEVGKGTTFTVRLPPAGAQTQRKTPTPLPTPLVSRRGRIMVIDDEPSICASTRRALAAEHDVVMYTNARAAHEALAAGERFDLILCDVMMPEM